MSRLQKRCLLASGGFHAFLLVVLLFGTAFITPTKKPLQADQLHVVPTRLIDAAFSGGGGNPNAPRTEEQVKGTLKPPTPAPPTPKPPAPKPEPPAPKPEPPAPPPAQPKPQTKKEEPRPTPPAKDNTKKAPKLVPKTTGKAEDTEPPKIELKRVTKSQSESGAAQAKAEARARELAAQQTAANINKVLGGLRAGFEQGTAVETHGPGGEAYANYEQFVKSIYEDAWVVSGDFEDEKATAKATIVIARDGNVISSHLSKRSGNALLDRSVQAALNKVRFVAPFPKGATEASRTFIINFNLNAKRLAG